MKKILTLVVGLTMLLAGHAQKHDLVLNLTKGEVYTQRTVSDISIYQKVNGQDMDLSMSIGTKMTFKVKDYQNSVYDMEVKYESITMKMSVMNNDMTFSSDGNDTNDILSGVLGSLKDKTFGMKITKKGIVKEVNGLDELFLSSFENNPHLPDFQKKQMTEQVKQSLGEKTFKNNIEMTLSVFNDAPVSKGEKWTINSKIESGISSNIISEYELKDITQDNYHIIGHSKIETDNKTDYVETNGVFIKHDIAGTMISDIQIDKKTGWTTQATISQAMEGTNYVKETAQMPDGMTIPLTINTKMTITDK